MTVPSITRPTTTGDNDLKNLPPGIACSNTYVLKEKEHSITFGVIFFSERRQYTTTARAGHVIFDHKH